MSAAKRRYSSTLISRYSGARCGKYPRLSRTARVLSKTSNPLMRAVPADGAMKHVRMRIVVLLPAPLGPRKPTTSPRRTSKFTLSIARNSPKLLLRSFA